MRALLRSWRSRRDETRAGGPARRAFTTGQLITLVAGSGLGLAIGIGAYTFGYARGASYLVDDPQACANCHVMREQHDGWLKSSHHMVATCNDCHTPPGLVAKYLTKASNGFWHSFYFTTGRFPEPIRIRERNRRVTESACRKCHGELAAAMDASPGGATECLSCHNSVGHPEGLGRAASKEQP